MAALALPLILIQIQYENVTFVKQGEVILTSPCFTIFREHSDLPESKPDIRSSVVTRLFHRQEVELYAFV
jgi:hypothetical protein